jgi:hypothetical protein
VTEKEFQSMKNERDWALERAARAEEQIKRERLERERQEFARFFQWCGVTFAGAFAMWMMIYAPYRWAARGTAAASAWGLGLAGLALLAGVFVVAGYLGRPPKYDDAGLR